MSEQEYEIRTQVDERIVEVYRYGSRVYGCDTNESDYDYIFIVESDNDELYYSVEYPKTNITVYSGGKFIKLIQEHKIHALECIFQAPSHDKYIKYFELDLEKLRRSISAVSSNSYVKCKKKLAQNEVYIGKKSLFHSLRILNFGIQIAKYGKITSYSSANYFKRDIFDMSNDWNEIDTKYKPIYNAMKTLFRKLAPLESEAVGDKQS